MTPSVDVTHARRPVDRKAERVEAVVELAIEGEIILGRIEGLAPIARREFARETFGVAGVILLDIGADITDIVAHDRTRDPVPGRAVDAGDIGSGQAGAAAAGKIGERRARTIDPREAVAIAVIAAGEAAVVTKAGMKILQEMRLAEFQGQGGPHRRTLV